MGVAAQKIARDTEALGCIVRAGAGDDQALLFGAAHIKSPLQFACRCGIAVYPPTPCDIRRPPLPAARGPPCDDMGEAPALGLSSQLQTFDADEFLSILCDDNQRAGFCS